MPFAPERSRGTCAPRDFFFRGGARKLEELLPRKKSVFLRVHPWAKNVRVPASEFSIFRFNYLAFGG